MPDLAERHITVDPDLTRQAEAPSRPGCSSGSRRCRRQWTGPGPTSGPRRRFAAEGADSGHYRPACRWRRRSGVHRRRLAGHLLSGQLADGPFRHRAAPEGTRGPGPLGGPLAGALHGSSRAMAWRMIGSSATPADRAWLDDQVSAGPARCGYQAYTLADSAASWRASSSARPGSTPSRVRSRRRRTAAHGPAWSAPPSSPGRPRR